MIKRLTLLLALVALLVPAGSAGAAAAKPEKQQRIVALTPFAANTLAKLGKRPIAIGETLGGRERFSPMLKGVRVLPLSHPNGPNLEQIASLDPDVVYSGHTWAKGNQAMQQLGIRVIVREPRSVSGAFADTFKIARQLGRKQQGRRMLEQQRNGVKAAEKGISSRPKVMLILGVGRTPFTFLRNSWGGDIVERAGGELLTAGQTSKSGFVRISDEVVVAEDPDVIIAVPHANASDIPELTEYLKANPAWAATSAVRNGRLYISNDNSLLQPGTDIAQTIRKVRRQYLQN